MFQIHHLQSYFIFIKSYIYTMFHHMFSSFESLLIQTPSPSSRTHNITLLERTGTDNCSWSILTLSIPSLELLTPLIVSLLSLSCPSSLPSASHPKKKRKRKSSWRALWLLSDMCRVGDDKQANIWDLLSIEDPILARSGRPCPSLWGTPS